MESLRKGFESPTSKYHVLRHYGMGLSPPLECQAVYSLVTFLKPMSCTVSAKQGGYQKAGAKVFDAWAKEETLGRARDAS